MSNWWPPISNDVTPEDYRILAGQQRCTWCAQRRTKEGHDPCIARLPGVQFACCGHGGAGYVAFASGQVIDGGFRLATDGPVWFPECPLSQNEMPPRAMP